MNSSLHVLPYVIFCLKVHRQEIIWFFSSKSKPYTPLVNFRILLDSFPSIFARFSMLEHFRGDWAYKLSKFEWQAIKIWIVMKSCEGALAGKGLFPLLKHGEPRQYSSLPMLFLCMQADRPGRIQLKVLLHKISDLQEFSEFWVPSPDSMEINTVFPFNQNLFRITMNSSSHALTLFSAKYLHRVTIQHFYLSQASLLKQTKKLTDWPNIMFPGFSF